MPGRTGSGWALVEAPRPGRSCPTSFGSPTSSPSAYGLIFERFLNPGRRSMPDIDMDFDERYRAEMIRYAAEKYGQDRVAQIITFATIKGKQAIRDSARVMGHPYSLGDRVAKAMPPSILGKDPTLDQVLNPPEPGAPSEVRDWYANAQGLRELYETDPAVREVVDVARGLEGLRRQDSIHAAAVVIAPEPLDHIVPVQRKGEGAETVTQFEMYGVEDLGLLKMDFLGLRNLSIMERCLELLEQTTGERVDIDAVPLDDQKTFELLQTGNTIGVFQMEGTAMRALIRSLRPDSFDDVIALVALFRPGPMGANMHNLYADRKNGRAPVEELHPAVTDKLADTYQIMVYQEQVMMVAQELAGYSMADADNLRRAMGKKIKSVMAAEEEKFVAGCISQGHTEETGREMFRLIGHFAGYGFNRSHAAGYGLVAYQTAFLKAHYPAEYLASLLTATKSNKDRTAIYLNECRQMGIEVLVPDVNESESDFTVHDGRIRFGLSAIRNVGEGVVEKVAEARAGEPFTSFLDFVNRVDLSALNKRTVESLIKAGAFDALGHSRKGLTLMHELVLDATVERRRNEEMGQYSLFSGETEVGPQENFEIPGPGVGPEDQARVREGDAGALRLRPSAVVRRLGARCGDHDHHRRPERHDRPLTGDAGRDRGCDHPALDQERRPDAVLPARGSRGVGRGHRLPQDGPRVRAAGGRRHRGGRQRASRPPRGRRQGRRPRAQGAGGAG